MQRIGHKEKCKMAIMKVSDMVRKIPVSVDKKIKQKDYLLNGALRVVDQGEGLVGGYTNDISKTISTELPVIVFGDHTRAIKYINFPFGAGADGIKVLKPEDGILPKYLFYGLQYLVLSLEDRGYARHYQYLEKMALRTTDVKEQKRIVTRIEELFSELDNGVETLKKTKEQLVVYRQAVLYNAFEGITNSTDMGNLAHMIDPQPSHRTPPEVAGGIPYIGVGDIDYEEKCINYSAARKVSSTVLDEHIERYTLHEGDFIMGKIGTIGKPFKVPLPQDYALSANVILIQPDREKVMPDFLYWQFSSPLVTKQLTEGATATSQPAFGITKARLLSIKICGFDMQKEIVREIESRLSICDSIEQAVNDALQQAEAMRQSILKQAFEGGV